MLDFSALLPYVPLLAAGLGYSLVLVLLAGAGGLALGIVLAEAQRSSKHAIVWPVRAFIEVMRNTPFLIQLFFIYFGFASMGLHLGSGFAAWAALTCNISAYFAEILRAGLESVQSGQREAAASLGLKPWQVFGLVILPPALAKVWPTLVSQFVLVFLGSSVVSQISAADLTFAAQFVQSRTFRAFETYITATCLYAGAALAIRAGLMRLSPVMFAWTKGR